MEPFVIPKPVGRPPVPDRVTIYDRAGQASDRFPIDARECVESGEYFYEKPEGSAVEDEANEAAISDTEQPDQPPSDGEAGAGSEETAAPAETENLDALTVAKLKDLAAERGVDLGGATLKADIIAAIRQGDN